MDLGMTTTAAPRCTASGYPASAGAVPADQSQPRSSTIRQSQQPRSNGHAHRGTPATPNKHVNFGSGNGTEEKKREKFLTAKYGSHQMSLIRKRLRVEMWMYERLQELYGEEDIEIDLDEVLDMDSDMERRQYIINLLRENQAARESVNLFTGELLEKVKTL